MRIGRVRIVEYSEVPLVSARVGPQMHGAKFVDGESSSHVPDTFLAEEHGPWGAELDEQTHQQKKGRKEQEREKGEDDDILEYALEWAFFTRCQWGEFDTALYELERCWGRVPECPTLIGGGARSRAVRALAPSLLGAPVTVPVPAEYVAVGAARQAAWCLSTSMPPEWPVPTADLPDLEPDVEVRAAYAAARDAELARWGKA